VEFHVQEPNVKMHFQNDVATGWLFARNASTADAYPRKPKECMSEYECVSITFNVI